MLDLQTRLHTCSRGGASSNVRATRSSARPSTRSRKVRSYPASSRTSPSTASSSTSAASSVSFTSRRSNLRAPSLTPPKSYALRMPCSFASSASTRRPSASS
jgi:hypothetical protein